MQPSSLAANPNYALGQLARALATQETHVKPDVRARAKHKAETWANVFQSMLTGTLQVGSRVPVAGAPAWATLEVAHGGFATGRLLAAGDLQPHEHELLERLPPVPPGRERAALNAYYLGDQGLEELNQLLDNGCYRIHLPEEGALLTVAWLVRHGHADQARALLDVISSEFPRLRFYPVPDSRPLTAGSVVHLQGLGTTIDELQNVTPSPLHLLAKEAIGTWIPLYDRVVELYAETVNGPLPTLQLGPDNKPLRSATGKYSIEGGWPCQHYPPGWAERARAVLTDYERLRKDNTLCSSPESAKGGFATLRRYLEPCIRHPDQLTGRDVGLIRSILAGIFTNRGRPGSGRHQALRAHQARQIAGPTRADLAAVLVSRLAGFPRDEGLASLDYALAPLRPEEAERLGVAPAKEMPPSLVGKVRRALDAPVATLVEQGIIPSAEVLAKVVPQITSQVRAAAIADAPLRRLYGAVYSAFRRRRSLLLLNLQSQVKLDELPWVQAMKPHRSARTDAQQLARQTLEEIVVLSLTSFPQQIFPNKLLQEIRALADGAALKLPLVEEVAADIFMGTFSEKFLHAARKAGELLEGTLYERYYALTYANVRAMRAKRKLWGVATSPDFAKLCTQLAGESGSASGWGVARNGKIIEQEQILTTHNLAVLCDALGLRESLALRWEELAHRCFGWVCQRLQHNGGAWQARLQNVKNAAYAWRQMVFFLSVAPAGVAERFLTASAGRLHEQPREFQELFRPAVDGLAQAAQGAPISGDQRFLGWTTERHWLLR